MATATASHIPETIRLQLRKPKSWHWELSTSKSSPSIILPIIQLYDYKGHLLVETKDTENTTERKIWHSTDIHLNNNSRANRHIRRSRSDTLSFVQKKSPVSINQQDKFKRRQSENSLKNTNEGKDSNRRLNSLKSSKSSDVVEKTAIKENGCQVSHGYGTNRLEKSKSELYDCQGHLSLSNTSERNGVEGRRRHRRSKSDDLFRRKLRYNSSSVESIKRAEIDGYRNFITPNIPHYKNQIESLNRGQEGKDETETATMAASKNRKPKRNRAVHNIENMSLNSITRNTELEEFLHTRRYTTRTSSAGTLIIPEESFKDNSHRRKRNRRRRDGVHVLDSLTETQLPTTQRNMKDPRMRFADEKHIRQSSDPSALMSREKLAKYAPFAGDRSLSSFKEAAFQEKHRQTMQNQPAIGLLYSHSEISPLKKICHQVAKYDENHNYCDQNLNYPTTKDNNNKNATSQDKIKNRHAKNENYREKSCDYKDKNNNFNEQSYRYDKSVSYRDLLSDFKNRENKNSYDICEIVDITDIENIDKKSSSRKSRSRTVNPLRSSSSSSKEGNNETIKGHLIKEHSASQRDKQARSSTAAAVVETGGKDTNDLLKLVRRLSYSYTAPKKPNSLGDGEDVQQVENNDVKMGANVSRHSAKGLGRRSQSSGSICNGSGSGSGGKASRHPEGKICSSLPSYLDDREKNGTCNNNHDRKHPLDEDRIPPLGDSAPLHWKFSDTQIICDQGYGSERSPEEEYPPPLTSLDQETLQCHHHLEPHACYPFITPESTFLVKLTKGSRGLGLSVTGGIDSTGSWPGLIRIKRLFPHQPASSCGLLNVGDLLLEANGITLTGLTNYEALEVLRTASNHVELKVCRPPPDVLHCVSPISEVPPPPPRREPPNSLNVPSNAYTTPEDEYYHGEFEITLKKIQGSLGFTLRKEDDSALGHYVRALVREPALTDGRIRAGDKIIAVNDVEICPMSHEQAVQFLRQCPEIVKLRLYRDSAQTPVATLSPTETTPRTSFSRKANLRQEAVDMLNDLAGRKLVGMNPEVYNRSLSPTSSSPRRLRRQPGSSDTSHGDYLSQGELLPPTEYLIQSDQPSQSVEYADYQEQFHEGIIQKFPLPFDEDAFNSLFSMESEDGDKPNRPSSLELYNPNQTPVASRKPRFNFSLAHNAYELNNLDAEVLDAPNLKYNLCNEDVKTSDSEVQEPVSMPHISTNSSSNFSHKHPAYQSAHPQIHAEHEQAQPTKSTSKTDGNTLRKTKKSVENKEVVKPNLIAQRVPMKEEYEVLAIELNRGWNSRLGFSLQGAAGVTYVSAVHADSVAARDGRLKPGDRLIKVNDESIEHMTTSEIIDLLRIVRGPVCIVISRVKCNEDCPESNAEN